MCPEIVWLGVGQPAGSGVLPVSLTEYPSDHVPFTARVAVPVVVAGRTCVTVPVLNGWPGLPAMCTGDPLTVLTPPVAEVTVAVSLSLKSLAMVHVMSKPPALAHDTLPVTTLLWAKAGTAKPRIPAAAMAAPAKAFAARRVQAEGPRPTGRSPDRLRRLVLSIDLSSSDRLPTPCDADRSVIRTHGSTTSDTPYRVIPEAPPQRTRPPRE